jgi:uroporphyrinogen decarboxylase
MTPRQRWEAVLTRQRPDRVPMDYWATPEFTAKLIKHLNCSDEREMFEKLHVDRLVQVQPEYMGPKLPNNMDVFGCAYTSVDYGLGVYLECVSHPLAQFSTLEEIERHYSWPSPDWWDYSTLPLQLLSYSSYPIQGGGSEPFLTYKNLRGQEQALMDLIINPQMVHYCLDMLFDLAYQNTQRIYQAIPYQVMVTYVAEDLGGQQGLMISPGHIHEFLIPRMKRVIDLVHEAGAFVFHHNDGNCLRIIPDMIEVGIDALNPIQWRAGLDRETLKRDFGDKIVFHGAVDNQYTLPFGTVEDVQQEVIDNLCILGHGGGYILAPCHNIQSNTPPENVVAMYETGYGYGWV